MVISFVTLTTASTALAQSPRYNAQDLGFRYCDSLSDSGRVVGSSYSYNPDTSRYRIEAFLYTGNWVKIGEGFEPFGVNNSGKIVGRVYSSDSYGTRAHAFLYNDGVLTDLGTLGGRWAVAIDINSLGQVIGNSLLADGQTRHAFLYSSNIGEGKAGEMLDLGGVWAMDINDSGQVVGYTIIAGTDFPVSFLYNGTLTLLEHIPAFAVSINNAGQILCNGYGYPATYH